MLALRRCAWVRLYLDGNGMIAFETLRWVGLGWPYTVTFGTNTQTPGSAGKAWRMPSYGRCLELNWTNPDINTPISAPKESPWHPKLVPNYRVFIYANTRWKHGQKTARAVYFLCRMNPRVRLQTYLQYVTATSRPNSPLSMAFFTHPASVSALAAPSRNACHSGLCSAMTTASRHPLCSLRLATFHAHVARGRQAYQGASHASMSRDRNRPTSRLLSPLVFRKGRAVDDRYI